MTWYEKFFTNLCKQPTAEEIILQMKIKDEKKWSNLNIQLRKGRATFAHMRLDYIGNSLLIFLNGILLGEKKYNCFRENLKIVCQLYSGDEITIINLETSEIKRVTLNENIYKRLTIQGDKKILEI